MRFFREHIVGMVLFALVTGIAANYVYDRIKSSGLPSGSSNTILPPSKSDSQSVQIPESGARNTEIDNSSKLALPPPEPKSKPVTEGIGKLSGGSGVSGPRTVQLPPECPEAGNGLIQIRPDQPACVIDYPKYSVRKEQIPDSAGPGQGTVMIVSDCSDPQSETIYRNFPRPYGPTTPDYFAFLERVRSRCVVVRSTGTGNLSFNILYGRKSVQP